MLPPSNPENGTSLFMIEGGLTIVALALAFCLPRLGASFFSRIERSFARVARRKLLAVAVVGLTGFLLRLAILPFCPIPIPFVPDDFSFLLAADTFAHGRLTNPTPAMWTHFESIHVSMNPSYMSMYFPAQGLVLAASKLLFGHPWYGLLFLSALMCAALCWMLQAWLPPTWAFLGGLMAVLHLGLFSYWINTYHAAGSIAALGGALILGALPRILRTPKLQYTMILAAGIVILGCTRPYECVLLCLPVGFVLARSWFFGNKRLTTPVLLRLTAAPLLLVIAGGAWMGYYDYRAFGKATTLPYTINRATYAMAPYYVWQPARPEPAYRHKAMHDFYHIGELDGYKLFKTVPGAILETIVKVVRGVIFFAGIALLPLIFLLGRVARDRRTRFLVISVLILAAGMAIEIFLLPHYLAAFTAAFYAIGLQAMRHLRQWYPEGKPVGSTTVRLLVTVCVIIVGLRLFPGPLRIALPEWPASHWNFNWYGPDHYGTERLRVEKELTSSPGKQLVIVRYSPRHNPFDEWVYNAADIDAAKVIWARDMGAVDNSELIQYYKDRQVWVVESDNLPAPLTSYSPINQTNQLLAASH